MSEENDKSLPPNEKVWDEDDREMIQDGLPGHMVLSDTDDIRVGRFFQVECGHDVRIENIEEETQEIVDLFDSFGVEVGIPLVGMIRRQDERGPTVGYKIEIENWVAQGNL